MNQAIALLYLASQIWVTTD